MKKDEIIARYGIVEYKKIRSNENSCLMVFRNKTPIEAVIEAGGICFMCGETDIIELKSHHLFSREINPTTTIPLCNKCHRQQIYGKQHSFGIGLILNRFLFNKNISISLYRFFIPKREGEALI